MNFTVKTILPYVIIASLFLVMFFSEFASGPKLVTWISAVGIVFTVVAAILSLNWLKRPLYSVYDLICQLNRGKLPETRGSKARDEIGDLERELEQYIQHQKEMVEFTRVMADGDYARELRLLSEEDQMRSSLHMLRDSLEKSRIDSEKRRMEDEHRTWTAQGLARFGSLLRETEDNLEDLAVTLMRELVKYTVANVGGLFVLSDENSEEGEQVLKLIGSYAFDKEKYNKKYFFLGEGLVGGAAVEKDMIYITDVPEGYLKIVSGLGEDLPSSLLLVPVILEDKVLGVIELASFEPFPSYQRSFINSICETVAITLSRVRSNLQTNK